METQAPDITNSATIGQVVVSSPIATPTLSPAGPPIPPPYYPAVASTTHPFFPGIPTAIAPEVELDPKMYVGKPLIIYGYGPVYSSVHLNGIGVSEKTTTDATGYFVFDAVYSHTLVYPDLCLQAVDTENRTTQPSCIPGLPKSGNTPSKVGPVLLSPTLSLNSNNVLVNANTKAEGLTIPNSKVEVYISRQEERNLGLIKNAYAYDIPVYQVESNEKGELEFSLPTQDSIRYRLYIASFMGEDGSAKSNTLTFSVLTPTQTNFNWFREQFIQNKIAWFIILEIVIILFLAWAIVKNPSKKHIRKPKIRKLTKSPKNTQKNDNLLPHVGLKNKYVEFFKKIGIIS